MCLMLVEKGTKNKGILESKLISLSKAKLVIKREGAKVADKRTKERLAETKSLQRNETGVCVRILFN